MRTVSIEDLCDHLQTQVVAKMSGKQDCSGSDCHESLNETATAVFLLSRKENSRYKDRFQTNIRKRTVSFMSYQGVNRHKTVRKQEVSRTAPRDVKCENGG